MADCHTLEAADGAASETFCPTNFSISPAARGSLRLDPQDSLVSCSATENTCPGRIVARLVMVLVTDPSFAAVKVARP